MVGSRQYGFRRMDLRGQSERPAGSVVADGDRTRYQGGAYEVREASGRIASTWVVPQDFSLVPNGAGLYFFYQKSADRRGNENDPFNKTMAGQTMARLKNAGKRTPIN